MIPRLDELQDTERTYRAFLDELPRAGFTGDVHVDDASRVVHATDNSVYQMLPQAVVHPRTPDDVVRLTRLAAEERFREVVLAPRGGGTGTNGQSLTDGVVVDTSRHMDAILEVNAEEGWARVQPGVVLDRLNAHLKPYGLFFAPHVSPSSRATVGGMIATDACGKGSRVYGRTSQHVRELELVLADGTTWRSRTLEPDELAEVEARDDRVGALHRTVHERVEAKREAIRERFPKLQRFMTGYNLAMVHDEETGRFDLSYLLAGSEGTLGLVTEAVVNLEPVPRHKKLIALQYASFDDALGAAEQLVRTEPGAIETIDHKILELARGDVLWHRVGPILEEGLRWSGGGGGRGAGRQEEVAEATRAVNLVEYEGPDVEVVERRVRELLEDLEARRGEAGQPVGWRVARDEGEVGALWALRKKGVGLLGRMPGNRKPVPFVEDTVVPPEQLSDYVREFRGLLDEAGLDYGMFGHVDVGCLHVRPALDMRDPEDERLLRRISDRVVEIVRRRGGMIWGEHGKGLRSEYNPVFFGAELYRELCRIKEAFDPDNKLNPGKLAVPASTGGQLRTIDEVKRGRFDGQIPAPVSRRWALALDCNGNGACFDADPDSVMCPSSKVTRDRVHSPKGRAGVMREWMRQLANAGADPIAELEQGPRPRFGPLRFLARLWRTLRDRRRRDDFSHAVYEAMDGCLACKACATQCPVKVDVPAFRAEFLEVYHGRYLRPLRDHFVALLETLVRPMSWAPRLTNAAMRFGPARAFVERVVGIVDAPTLSVPTARDGLRARGVPAFDPERVAQLDEAERERTVAILPDAFTTYYDATTLLAIVDLIAALGYRPEVMPYRPSGKGLHVKGFVRRFRRVAARWVPTLQRATELGVPVVGVDPAVALIFRDEVPHALGREATQGVRVKLLQEWLDQVRDALRARAPAAPGGPYRLFGHCTERTAEAGSQEGWARAFEALGCSVEPIDVGCCGMCGVWGHERHHVEESKGIFDMSWARHLPRDEAERARVLAPGYSCRSQTKRCAGFRPAHPAEALLREVEAASEPARLEAREAA